jgi:hypothetical protein
MERLPTDDEIRAAAVKRAAVIAQWKHEGSPAKQAAIAEAEARHAARAGRAAENYRLGLEFLEKAERFRLPRTAYSFRVKVTEPDSSWGRRTVMSIDRYPDGRFGWTVRGVQIGWEMLNTSPYSNEPVKRGRPKYAESRHYRGGALTVVDPAELARKMANRLRGAAVVESPGKASSPRRAT